MFICSFRFPFSEPPSTLAACGLQRSCAFSASASASTSSTPSTPAFRNSPASYRTTILPPYITFTLSLLRQFLCFSPRMPRDRAPPVAAIAHLPFPFWAGGSGVLLPDFLHNFVARLALSSFWQLALPCSHTPLPDPCSPASHCHPVCVILCVIGIVVGGILWIRSGHFSL